MRELMMPDERARLCSDLAACALASAAIEAPKSRRTPRGPTDIARLCPWASASCPGPISMEQDVRERSRLCILDALKVIYNPP